MTSQRPFILFLARLVAPRANTLLDHATLLGRVSQTKTAAEAMALVQQNYATEAARLRLELAAMGRLTENTVNDEEIVEGNYTDLRLWQFAYETAAEVLKARQ